MNRRIAPPHTQQLQKTFALGLKQFQNTKHTSNKLYPKCSKLNNLKICSTLYIIVFYLLQSHSYNMSKNRMAYTLTFLNNFCNYGWK